MERIILGASIILTTGETFRVQREKGEYITLLSNGKKYNVGKMRSFLRLLDLLEDLQLLECMDTWEKEKKRGKKSWM